MRLADMTSRSFFISTAAVFAVIALTFSASSLSLTTPPSEPEAVVRAFVEAANARSVEGQLALTADVMNLRMYSPTGVPTVDSQRNRDEQRYRFQQTKEKGGEFHRKILSIIVSGPVVATREEVSSPPPTPTGYALITYRVVDGKITQMWVLNTEGRP
jgi:hypothetical protein